MKGYRHDLVFKDITLMDFILALNEAEMDGYLTKDEVKTEILEVIRLFKNFLIAASSR